MEDIVLLEAEDDCCMTSAVKSGVYVIGDKRNDPNRNYFDDIYYTASIIEYTARRTCNAKSAIVKAMGIEAFQQFVDLADVNHCLSFLQVSDEIIEQYGITQGTCEVLPLHAEPSYLKVGAVYAKRVVDTESDPIKYWSRLYALLAQ